MSVLFGLYLILFTEFLLGFDMSSTVFPKGSTRCHCCVVLMKSIGGQGTQMFAMQFS